MYGLIVLRSHLARPEGDAEILVAAPLALWALAYLVGYLFLWRRGAAPRRAVLLSAAIATVVVALAYAAFIMISWMSGVGGQIVGLLPCSPCRV